MSAPHLEYDDVTSTIDFLGLPGLSVTRSTPGSSRNVDQSLQQFAANTARLTDRGLLVELASTNLALWSSDLTNPVWFQRRLTTAKTATGPDAVANSATTLTATDGYAYVQQGITSASAQRVTSIGIRRRAGSGPVTLTHGTTVGSNIVTTSDMSSTAGWSLGSGWSISGGVATWTPGSPSYLSCTGTVQLGKIYRVTFTITSVSGNCVAQPYIGGSPALGAFNTPGTYTVYGPATANNLGIAIRAAGTTGSVSVDNVIAFEVSETALAITSNWSFFEIPATTIANPEIILKLTTPGDAVDVYGVQHEIQPFATSTINTTTAAVSRAADSVSWSIDASDALTVFVDIDLHGMTSAFESFVAIASGDGSNLLAVVRNQLGSIVLGLVVNGDYSLVTLAENKVGQRRIKAAVTYRNGTYHSAVDGVLGYSTTTAAPSGFTKIYLGSSVTGSHTVGYLRDVHVSGFAVTDAELIAMTS